MNKPFPSDIILDQSNANMGKLTGMKTDPIWWGVNGELYDCQHYSQNHIFTHFHTYTCICHADMSCQGKSALYCKLQVVLHKNMCLIILDTDEQCNLSCCPYWYNWGQHFWLEFICNKTCAHRWLLREDWGQRNWRQHLVSHWWQRWRHLHMAWVVLQLQSVLHRCRMHGARNKVTLLLPVVSNQSQFESRCK